MEVFLTYVFFFASVTLVVLQANGVLSPWIAIPAVVLSWIGLAFLFGRRVGTSSYNFVGTRLYGKKPTENGYLATKWIIVALIPILPVATYEIFYEGNLMEEQSGRTNTQSQSFACRALPSLCWKQAVPTLLIGWSILGAIIFVLVRFT
ncbi:MAG TPA: hypothetical protein VN540_00215 [Clostridia bacterium]|nr:hypothetical protein [Clostridia bacterium]